MPDRRFPLPQDQVALQQGWGETFLGPAESPGHHIELWQLIVALRVTEGWDHGQPQLPVFWYQCDLACTILASNSAIIIIFLLFHHLQSSILLFHRVYKSH